MPASIVIKKDREKPIRNQHPWIFSGAIEAVRGNPTPGEIVTVVSHKGDFLARGYWNEKSQIQVRILTWQDEAIDEDWWRRMLTRAVDLRHEIFPNDVFGGQNISYRLVNAENDYLPGLVVDQYGDDQYGVWLVLQALTLHIDQQKAMLAELLGEIVRPRGIYERSDVDVRRKEGLQEVKGLLWGSEPKEKVQILENEISFLVDLRNGHKTGFYLDQHGNRRLLRLLCDGGDVLNLFSYTGGFGVHALLGGASHVVNVDTSREALELAERNVGLLELPDERAEYIQADVFEYLRDIASEGQKFDIVVCDPPKFAQNAQQVDKAARGYKDLNLYSFKVIKPGGYLMTFSCSGAISRDLFQKIVFGALADSGRQAQIIQHLSAGADHPVALTFPEGEYLKGLLLRVY